MRGISLVFTLLVLLNVGLVYAGERLLSWPVNLDQYPYQFGANISQYVRFGTTYFHAGQDIVAHAGKPVFATVSGKIEGGYYSYEDFHTGHSKKNFVPLSEAIHLEEPPLWGKNFFEIAIVDASGTRFEYHHIDFENLPQNILRLILDGGEVESNTLIGFVVSRGLTQFGIEYDHIHYNIIDSKGVYLNPFAKSEEVFDDVSPVLKPSYFNQINDNTRCRYRPGKFLHTTKENEVNQNVDYIVFEAFDLISGNKIPQALTKLEYIYNNKKTTYDFSQILASDADIRKIYHREFCIGDKRYPVNLNGSVNEKFYYKVSVPRDFKGELSINAFDFAGNKSSKKIMIDNSLL